MNRYVKYLILALLLTSRGIAGAQVLNDCTGLNDGPYIFKNNDKFRVKWIEDCTLREKSITAEEFSDIKEKFRFPFEFSDLAETWTIKPDKESQFPKADSIGIITDIHGNWASYSTLLINAGIIDQNLNWKFGAGHLVVLGDVFDRGDNVTEVLWHLYGLEKQALKAGGMVHMLLGNHETMVLANDLTYISNKYRQVETRTFCTYKELFSVNTVLGKWLRSKPVIISVDDILFVHAGLSTGMVNRKYSIKDINSIFRDRIIGREYLEISEDESLMFLSDQEGPLWYRGYFTDETFCEARLDSILNYYEMKHIVVGHTTIKGISSVFDHKLIAIDAGIQFDNTGEMLLFKEGVFYASDFKGKRRKL